MLRQTCCGSNRLRFQLGTKSLQCFAVSTVPMRFPTGISRNGFRLEAISLIDAAKLRVQLDTYKRYLVEPTSTTIKHLGGFRLCPPSVVRLEKTCAFKDFPSLRALPCDQSQTQTVENRHQSPRESAADSCQGSFAREEGKKSDSFSGLHRSRYCCIANSLCN